MNVVTQLTQFVGRDVINKNTTDLLRAAWLELCIVAINGPLEGSQGN